MKTNKKRFVPYRRKLSGRTNYRKRLKMLVSGSSRLVVRTSNKHIMVQVVDYSENGDHVIITAKSSELKQLGWDLATSNLPAAYLTGLLAGQKAKAKKATEAIADLGLQTPAHGSRLYAAIKGAIDAGMKIPCDESVFPPEDRLKGKHIADYNKKASGMLKSFDDVKSKILKG